MKTYIKKILQKLLGYRTYLYVFARYIIATLKWNKKESDFLHFIKLLPPRGTVLDLGANIGVMSVYLAKSLPGSRVLAFEPIPSNFQTIRKILKYYRLSNVEVIEKALGDFNGETEMVLPVVDNVKMQGLSHVVHDSIAGNNEGLKYKVNVCKLDDIAEINNNENAVTGIKIDVENYEYFVLLGGINLLKKHKPVVYTELWDNDNRDNCFELMQGLGYSVQVLYKNTLVPYNCEEHITQNFFFIPNN